MKLRHPGMIRLVAFLASFLIRLWMSTVRIRVDSRRLGRLHPTDASNERFVYAFWHESILAATHCRAAVHALISRHADGELIAQIAEFLGFASVRGSTTHGGIESLIELLDVSKRAHLAVTPDGPRGPRRRVQLGTIFLASRAGLPVVPSALGYSNAWRARSWDRFAIPMPFSTVYLVLGTPIPVPAKLNRQGLEQHRQLVEDRFLALTESAEVWARTGEAPLPVATALRASA